MQSFDFPKSSKITTSTDIKAILEKGRRYFDKNFVMLATKSSAPVPELRLCVIASRKVGGAPSRNFAKRRMRELFRHEAGTQTLPAMDLVLIGKNQIEKSSFNDLKGRFRNLLKQAANDFDNLPECRNQVQVAAPISAVAIL